MIENLSVLPARKCVHTSC